MAINGGAFYAEESAIMFRGILENTSYNVARDKGGALFLRKSQIQVLNVGPYILFDHNTVTSTDGKGGAIFVLDNSCKVTAYSENQCFVYNYPYVTDRKLLTFINNKGSQGSVLYGGLLDRCLPPPKFLQYTGSFNVLKEFQQIADNESGPLVISSEPIGVCLCINNSMPD